MNKRDLFVIYGPAGSGKTWLAANLEKWDTGHRSIVILDDFNGDLQARLRAARRYFGLVIVTSSRTGLVEGLGFKPTMIIQVERPSRRRMKGGRR